MYFRELELYGVVIVHCPVDNTIEDLSDLVRAPWRLFSTDYNHLLGVYIYNTKLVQKSYESAPIDLRLSISVVEVQPEAYVSELESKYLTHFKFDSMANHTFLYVFLANDLYRM